MRNVISFVVAAALLSLSSASAAPVWVFLNDKGYTTFEELRAARAGFDASLSPEAQLRRAARGVGSNAPGVRLQDLPIADRYIDSIKSTGADIRVRSSWLNAVSVDASPAQLARLRAMPFVDHIQPVAQFSRPQMVPEPMPKNEKRFSSFSGPEAFYGVALDQLNQISIPQVHALGYTGAGVRIGVLDTGFRRSHVAFNQAGHPINVLMEHDFLENDNDTSDLTNDQHQHGTYILGTIGAYQPNVIVGGAYDASFLLAKTEDVSQEVPAEEDYWVAGLEYLENNGADLVTSSLGYIDWYTQNQLNGQTAVTTVAAAAAAARGLVITNAAGNEGHDANPLTSHLIAPSDADLLIAVGAVDDLGDAAGFTSDGPTADGRVKPELMARGVSTATVTAFSDSGFTFVDGTSLATPLAASAVALIVQAHPTWSVEQIRHALFTTASRGGAFDPLYINGYGIINTLAAVQFSFDKIYTSASSGNWNNGSNWSNGTAPSQLSDVIINPTSALMVFGPTVNTRVHALSIDAQVGPNPAILQLSASTSFTIDQNLTIGQRGAVTQLDGTLIVKGNVINAGELNINRTAQLNRITGTGSTNVGAGGQIFVNSIIQTSLNLLGNARVFITDDGTVVKSLSVAGGSSPTARLDLLDHSITIDHAGAASPINTLAAQIAFAYHNGTWDRPGITSSAADASQFAVGVAQPTPTSVFIRLTRYGDADLNGTVDLDDFNALASNFNSTGKFWGQGNFNYDALGAVNLDDFNLLAGNFNLSAAGPEVTPEHWAALAAAIPEPSALLLTGVATSVAMRMCRRRT